MKTVITTIAAGLILTLIPIAHAAPVEVSGEATIKYEADSADKIPTESGMMYTVTLKGEKKLAKTYRSMPAWVRNMPVTRLWAIMT